MKRVLAYLLPLAAVAATAVASSSPAAAETPKEGEALVWPTLKTWLEDPPVANDAAGKVVVHWFCSARAPLCKDDLARLVSLREAGKIYVIGYINGGKRDAQKLDPVRSAIAGGAVAYGPQVTKLMKTFAVGAGPAAIVVGVDGKIAHVQLGGDPDVLDKRDAKVNELVAAIKEFTVVTDGPAAAVKVGERFEFKVAIELAPWLSFNSKAPTEVALSLPTELKCDAQKLAGEQLKLEDRKLSAAFACSSTSRGSYEARAEYRFGYQSPNGSQALGSDGVRWKFQVKE
jgi:hypothetical protein